MLEMDREELRALYAASVDISEAGPAPMSPLEATVFILIFLAMSALLVWYMLW
jgi:hypothetical protein